MRLLVVLALVPLVSGCVARSVYEAMVARSRGLEVALVERDERIGLLEQRIRDLEKSGELLELERTSLDEERLELINSLEDLRTGNYAIREELELERSARRVALEEVEALHGTYTRLVDAMESELESGQIEIQELRGRLQVRALDQILFRSGSVEVSPQGREVLERVAAQLGTVRGYTIRVVGHTDDQPISTERFPSNWELSVARAAGVARVLAASGVDPVVLEVVGYGPFHPIAANDSRENRARNRRIEIVLAPVALEE